MILKTTPEDRQHISGEVNKIYDEAWILIILNSSAWWDSIEDSQYDFRAWLAVLAERTKLLYEFIESKLEVGVDLNS